MGRLFDTHVYAPTANSKHDSHPLDSPRFCSSSVDTFDIAQLTVKPFRATVLV